MFAPPVARAQKAAAKPINKMALQRSTPLARPSRGSTAESMTDRGVPSGVSWDFSKIAVFPPDRANRPPTPPAVHGAALPGMIQAKLVVGEVNDPLEHEADRVAERVMRDPMRDPGEAVSLTAGPPRLSRKCAACEDEENALRMKPARSDAAGAHAPALVHEVLRSPGRPLDAPTRAFFEPRFGHDFGAVRIHDNGQAAASARSVGALAYTVGRDIVFGGGAYADGTDAGRRLLAHELAHTVQQGRAPASQLSLQRKVAVAKPAANIDNPGGKGAVQTNAATIETYLKTLCPDGGPTVDPASGEVKIAPAFCTAPALAPGMAGPPAPSGVQMSKTATGCGCICDLVASANTWTIQVDDKDWPHTDFDDDDKANGVKPGGTGGTVTAPSPNSPKLWGAGTAAGAALNVDPWLVLGHEFCGHAWLGDQGKHGPDTAAARGEGGHQETVARENALRAEHGIDLRGTFKDPNCGESFWRDKKSPGKVNWSTFRDVCIKWRAAYNKANKTNFKITDKMP
jgi:Domain of unknown function (DUF4157)